MHELHDHALTPRASAKTHPCANPVAHRPRYVSTSGHHRKWQWAQRLVHEGDVPDQEKVYLCDNCHVALHAYGNAVLHQVKPPQVGRFLRNEAQIGIDYVREHNLQPPYPPLVVPADG